MRKRFLALCLCMALLLCMVPAAIAAEPAFTDISGHWAECYIREVSELELFSGTSETMFSPDAGMTRGMFVTVMGRLAGVDPADWLGNQPFFTDVGLKRYYAPYINWAVHTGVATGMTDFTFAPDALVTREQMAKFVSSYARFLGYQFKPAEKKPFTGDFSDEDEIAGWAGDAVDMLQLTGIISGFANEDGTYAFAPKNTATRAECSVIFSKLYHALVKDENTVEPEGVAVPKEQVTLRPGQHVLLQAQITPGEATNQTLTWTSDNPTVVRVTQDGYATWQNTGVAVLTVSTCNQKTASVVVEAEAQEDLAHAGESYLDKCIRVFGEYVDDPRTVYTTRAQAEENMVNISVRVWDISSSGEKITRVYGLTVHRNIAETVKQIFEEIYALPSKPPIHALGGYRWAQDSEHTPGLAIDINPNENYYCDPAGNALVGSFFDPNASEYSFAVGGEVEQIFNKYGFTRGIYWRSGYKDYMHFSFFGT